eukprot:gnl/TRDRNA2_/TRDRNA2_189951_c0_seq1.p1 gnl/TRDRNA2_/TRDRNA2_189951_c0~~gnl/TRDRNA2_/TRDRNA2_189951_c0_seq1.p1  ORF type:complete len:525 (+),score=91.09 gnl/TRDRNA2_/TRDRNA2_189951_c0_seq1:210-1577(+)
MAEAPVNALRGAYVHQVVGAAAGRQSAQQTTGAVAEGQHSELKIKHLHQGREHLGPGQHLAEKMFAQQAHFGCCAPFQRGRRFDHWLNFRRQKSGLLVAKNSRADGQPEWNIVIAAGTGDGFVESRARLMFKSWFQHLLPGQLAFFVSDKDDDEMPMFVLPKQKKGGSGYHQFQTRMLEFVTLMAVKPPVSYNWLLLADDDTFVHPRVLAQVLIDYEPRAKTPLMIGQSSGCNTMCGGAGILLNRATTAKMALGMPDERAAFSKVTWYDSSLSQLIEGRFGVRHVEDIRFHASPKLDHGGKEPFATLHYIKDAAAVGKWEKVISSEEPVVQSFFQQVIDMESQLRNDLERNPVEKLKHSEVVQLVQNHQHGQACLRRTKVAEQRIGLALDQQMTENQRRQVAQQLENDAEKIYGKKVDELKYELNNRLARAQHHHETFTSFKACAFLLDKCDHYA